MNKNKNTHTFIRSLRGITLPKDTQVRMRAELAAYADLHTVPERVPAQSLFPRLSFSFLKQKSAYAGALALLLVIATGSEAAFASERTLPGDILYPVKVAVAEPIALALAPAGEEKAELSTKFASRRVVEAAALSEKGELTDARAEELAMRFETHIDTADKEAQMLEAKGDIDAALAVRTDLEQGITDQVEALAPASPVAMLMDVSAEPMMVKSAKMAVVVPEQEESTPTARFFERVGAKARAFADTRTKLESAIAVRVATGTDVSTGLAVVEADDLLPEEGDAAASSVRILSYPASGELEIASASTSILMLAKLASTTEATTTEEAEPMTKGSSPASRFFAPFFSRDHSDK